ncbi:MAG TPA: hypothetical protein VEW74_06970 [Candidatus Nitrosotalea sp.]|nr:hypothetical protein [Candidatus Nitrosotalea sp.]
MMTSPGDLAAWAAAILFPLTGVAGWLLRRYLRGAIVTRMRPHFVLGYSALTIGAIHGMLAMGGMRAMSRLDVWLAVLALLGLGLQVLVGLSLQEPGAYRSTLRRWHVVATWTVGVLIVGHIVLTR